MSLPTKTFSSPSSPFVKRTCLMNSLNIQPHITGNVAEYSLNSDDIQKMIELEQSRECYKEEGVHVHHFDARNDAVRMSTIEKNLRKQLDEATDTELKKAIENILAAHLKQ